MPLGHVILRQYAGRSYQLSQIDAFDTLYREGEDQARVLPIALPPFLIGAAHCAPHLAKALDYICGHERVWFARGGEILDAYRAVVTG